MFKSLFQKEFFHDRPALILAVLGLGLGVLNIMQVILRVQSRDFDVPIRYSQYGGSPIELGNWYELYSLAVFAVVATVVNLVLALRVRTLQRSLSMVILLLNVLIMTLLLLVSNSLLGVAPTG